MKSVVRIIPKVPITLDTNATPVPIAYMTSMFRVRFRRAMCAARKIGYAT